MEVLLNKQVKLILESFIFVLKYNHVLMSEMVLKPSE